jgi:hypothetical protein
MISGDVGEAGGLGERRCTGSDAGPGWIIAGAILGMLSGLVPPEE